MLSMDEYRVLTDIRRAVRDIRDHLMTAPAPEESGNTVVPPAAEVPDSVSERLTRLEEGLARAHKAAVEANVRVSRLNDIQGHRDPYLRRIEEDLDRLCLGLLELLPEDYPGAFGPDGPAEDVLRASLQMDPSP